MSHSPRLKTDTPNHEDVNTPTKKIKVIEVTNLRPDNLEWESPSLYGMPSHHKDWWPLNSAYLLGATVTGSAAVIGSQHSSVLIPRTDEKSVEDLQRVYQEKTNGSYKTLQDNDHSPALNTKMDENCKDNAHRGNHHKEWVKHLHLKKPDYT
nr:pentatricopeptide repeat-containing protein At5g21222-like [Ipomoea batatas]